VVAEPELALDWRKPLELIAEGEYRRVIGAVLAMAGGVTAKPVTIDTGRLAPASLAPFSDRGWRHFAPRYEPLGGEGARLHGGRFNPPGSFSVLYLCQSRPCVPADLRRLGEGQAIGSKDCSQGCSTAARSPSTRSSSSPAPTRRPPLPAPGRPDLRYVETTS